MIANYPYFGLPNYMRYMNMGMPIKPSNPIRPNFYVQGNSFRKQSNNDEKYYSSKIPRNNNIQEKTSYSNTQARDNSNRYNLNINNVQDSSPMFNLLGLNIYFDDILIICILFFLYNEGVNDPYLFLILVLLLMS